MGQSRMMIYNVITVYPFINYSIILLFLLASRYMPAQMRADTWAQFPLAIAIPWDGVRSLVVEIAYQNLDQRSPTGAVWMNAATYVASVSSTVAGMCRVIFL